MTAAIIETKRIDGKPAHRIAGTPDGAWVVSKSEIDAMLDHVQRELCIRRVALRTAIGVDRTSLSQCSHGVRPLRDRWILLLSSFSGISVAEMLRVACMEPFTQPHQRARRVA